MKPYSSTILFTFLTILLHFTSPSHQQQQALSNPRLMSAYIALQAWKLAIIDDPNMFTSNWLGPEVCNYTGIYCAPAPDDQKVRTVAGIDLNHANIAGFLPKELGLLKDLAFFHINSNRFYGTIPDCFADLHLLYELDLSNNLFSGSFPYVVLYLPSLIYLDIRYNEFCGVVPPELFDLKLDALFINNNKFKSLLPDNIGNSPVSVFVASNNFIAGCIPPSLARMSSTLDEILLSNMLLSGCLGHEIGALTGLKVFDVSFNGLSGKLPETIGNMRSLEQLNVAHNKFSGPIPQSICLLPRLENFIYYGNYFSSEPKSCSRLRGNDDRMNCIPDRPLQRSAAECTLFYAHPFGCGLCPSH